MQLNSVKKPIENGSSVLPDNHFGFLEYIRQERKQKLDK